MRGNSDKSDTYPFRTKYQQPNLPISGGGWAVFNVAKQEFVGNVRYPNEAEAEQAVQRHVDSLGAA